MCGGCKGLVGWPAPPPSPLLPPGILMCRVVRIFICVVVGRCHVFNVVRIGRVAGWGF